MKRVEIDGKLYSVRESMLSTMVRTDSAGVLRVTLYETDVLTVWPNGRIMMDFGRGWGNRTGRTTLERINRFALLNSLKWKAYKRRGNYYAWNWETGEEYAFDGYGRLIIPGDNDVFSAHDKSTDVLDMIEEGRASTL